MAIVNFKINKISGERKKDRWQKVSAKANSTIASMKLEKDKNIGEYLLVNFKYEVTYEPDIGDIVLDGTLWYLHPDLKSMVKEEKESLELKNEAIREISTAVIRDSLLESLDISRKLQLPPPLQLPTVNVKPDQLKFKKAS